MRNKECLYVGGEPASVLSNECGIFSPEIGYGDYTFFYAIADDG